MNDASYVSMFDDERLCGTGLGIMSSVKAIKWSFTSRATLLQEEVEIKELENLVKPAKKTKPIILILLQVFHDNLIAEIADEKVRILNAVVKTYAFYLGWVSEFVTTVAAAADFTGNVLRDAQVPEIGNLAGATLSAWLFKTYFRKYENFVMTMISLTVLNWYKTNHTTGSWTKVLHSRITTFATSHGISLNTEILYKMTHFINRRVVLSGMWMITSGKVLPCKNTTQCMKPSRVKWELYEGMRINSVPAGQAPIGILVAFKEAIDSGILTKWYEGYDRLSHVAELHGEICTSPWLYHVGAFYLCAEIPEFDKVVKEAQNRAMSPGNAKSQFMNLIRDAKTYFSVLDKGATENDSEVLKRVTASNNNWSVIVSAYDMLRQRPDQTVKFIQSEMKAIMQGGNSRSGMNDEPEEE